ncbi:MAG: hypothetical protein H0X33_10035 [Taibaiella sp.]|nr:hypothetical protein [Taibaiella sp.]
MDDHQLCDKIIEYLASRGHEWENTSDIPFLAGEPLERLSRLDAIINSNGKKLVMFIPNNDGVSMNLRSRIPPNHTIRSHVFETENKKHIKESKKPVVEKVKTVGGRVNILNDPRFWIGVLVGLIPIIVEYIMQHQGK